MTVWVSLESADDPAVVGGKAASLRRCIAARLLVPAGGVVTIAAHRRLLVGEFSEPALAAAIRPQLASYPPDEVFAVRSSAEVEDSARASFAGQFQSLLNVSRDDVPAAVRAVQDSAANPSARRYAAQLGVPAPDALAVIVQLQVRARVAGVCFTVDPVTGRDDVLVEYALGTGDAVVGGHAVPAGSHRFRRAADGTLVPLADGEYLAEAQRVAATAVALESRFGRPQDVEWAYDAEQLWLLQARPVTTRVEK